MKLRVDTENLEGILGELNPVGSSLSQQNPHEFYSIPAQAGEGFLQRIRLRQGMEIHWFEAKFNGPICLDVEVKYPHLEIAYTLEGQGYWETLGYSRNYELAAGVSTFMYMCNEKLHSELSSRERMLQMEIRFDLRLFNPQLLELARITEKPFFCEQMKGAPQIPIIVEQMQHIPYNGSLRKLYLEGKALELLAFHLNCVGNERQRIHSKLSAEDVRCLREAKEILSHAWRQPPSLLELSRRIGLNDFKLKLGFKELYGTTVFGYVRGQRMNEARRMLEQGKANVSEAAIMVGYHNLSHFSAMFRKTFGYNPSECAKAAK